MDNGNRYTIDGKEYLRSLQSRIHWIEAQITCDSNLMRHEVEELEIELYDLCKDLQEEEKHLEVRKVKRSDSEEGVAE